MSNHSIQFIIPELPAREFSAFSLNKRAARDWCESLPKANLNKTSQALIEVLQELASCKLSAKRRLEILEPIKQLGDDICNTMSKYYLNQALIASERANSAAKLSESVNFLLAINLLIGCQELYYNYQKSSRLGRGDTKLLGEYIGLALIEHSELLLRRYQLYQNINTGTWRNTHQLFQLAQLIPDCQKYSITVGDKPYKINDLYLRCLLQASCSPNQLSQLEIEKVYENLLPWSQYCELGTLSSNSVFAVPFRSDNGPFYSKLLSPENHQATLGLNTKSLADHLSREQQNKSDKLGFSNELYDRLVASWSTIGPRQFKRRPASGTIEISLGIVNAHHYVSNMIPFEDLIQEMHGPDLEGDTHNIFLDKDTRKESSDVWSAAYKTNFSKLGEDMQIIEMDLGASSNGQTNSDDEQFSKHRAALVNISANGYCIEVDKDYFAEIKPGEIIAIKETNSEIWNIGILHWVKQSNDVKFHIGLELLSPNASPYGAKQLRANEKLNNELKARDFHRVFVLPGIPSMRIPPTILMPVYPFTTSNKILLVQNNNHSKVILTERIEGNKFFSQFTFKKFTVSAKQEPIQPQTKPADDNSIDF